MNKRLTAEDARKLAGPSIDDRVDEVLVQIAERAKAGKRSIHLHGDFWARAAYQGTTDYHTACSQLKFLGYTVKFYYKEHQFVDMYTIVEW